MENRHGLKPIIRITARMFWVNCIVAEINRLMRPFLFWKPVTGFTLETETHSTTNGWYVYPASWPKTSFIGISVADLEGGGWHVTCVTISASHLGPEADRFLVENFEVTMLDGYVEVRIREQIPKVVETVQTVH